MLAAVICVAALLPVGCRQAAFVPVPSPNPWADDYRAISAMEHYRSWGTYNVHDPSCRKLGDYYYMYSTDAIFAENRREAREKGVPLGFIQVRRSKDLVDWEFCGWAFPEIPREAIDWVRGKTGGQGATNIWAPYILPYGEVYRLYYCVSAFGRKTSYIGLAEASSPEGPWVQKGCVVKTDDSTPMNAIDPSIVTDSQTGRVWMHYGSFFDGLYCVELNPETGLTEVEGDLGHLTARRDHYHTDNQEAPEIIFHPGLSRYYLFTSYDPLMTTYNVRVGRSERAEGPFTDFSGTDLRDAVSHVPLLTAPYRFQGHPGWAGVAHCSVFTDNEGHYYMAHQARLAPDCHQMVLHLRQLFFTPDGWPVVSPERYAGTPSRKFSQRDLAGEWEIIRLQVPGCGTALVAGQITRAPGEAATFSESHSLTLNADGTLSDGGLWRFDAGKQLLALQLKDGAVENLIVFAGHDWEKEADTVLFTGLDGKGCSVWGKRVK